MFFSFWTTGSRPISPPQWTTVVSSRPALLEVAHQGGRGRSTLRHIGGQAVDDAAVVVPVLVAGADLHEADAALDQPPGDQAAACRTRAWPGRRGRRFLGSRAVSRAMSSASRAAVCIRAASSKLAMRAAGRARPACSSRWSRLSWLEVTQEPLLRPCPAGPAAGRGLRSAAPRADHRALVERRQPAAWTSCRPQAQARRPGRSARSRPAGSGSPSPGRRSARSRGPAGLARSGPSSGRRSTGRGC